MPAFDIRTAYVIAGMLYLVLPTFAWLVLAGQRSRQVALWCGGGLIFAVAGALIGLRGSIPGLMSYGLANLLMFAGLVGRIQAFRLDLSSPWRTRWMGLAALVFVLVYEFIRQGLHNDQLRFAFTSAVFIFLDLHLALLARRIGIEEESDSANWIYRCYLLETAAVVIRLFDIFLFGGPADAIGDSPASRLIILMLTLSAVVGNYGYIGLALDRARRREVLATAKQSREEEILRLGNQIAHLDRQRALGMMSASLGHELNQPLAAILTNAQVAKRGVQAGRFDSAKVTELLDKIVFNTQRAGQIIERIKGFIRPSILQMQRVELSRLVHEVAELVADEARTRKIVLKLPPVTSDLFVNGEPIQLSQIVLNILRNALEAATDRPQREVQVTCSGRGDQVVLEIRDTGPGFASATLAEVGTPFFTTKHSGLGMGLTISRAIAEQHGGTLVFGNVEGGGALVELVLPASDAPGGSR